MAGHIVVRCSSCRTDQPATRARCEGEGGSCAKNLKALANRDYYIVFYQDGRKRREHIGLHPNRGPAQTRLDEVLGEITEGKYFKRGEVTTFGELARLYMEKHGHKAKSVREYERLLKVELLPAWRDIQANRIKRRDVIALLDPIVDRAPVLANRTLTFIKMVLNWAVEREILESNPCYRMKRPTAEKPRERVLTDSEIRAFWHGVESPRIRPAVREALRMTLVTAQRPGEVAAAKLADLDRQEKRWTLPETKGGRSHTVPLSPLALELMLSLPREGAYLFTARGNGQAIAQTSMAHAIKKVPELKALGFTPHDLRRTAGTRMAEMGISTHTISRILNHAEGGMTRIYNRYGYDKEKREALNAWADKLRGIIEAEEGVSGGW